MANRPSAARLRECIDGLNEHHEIVDLIEQGGEFVSATIRSPHDSSAMDIIYVEGEEVREQVSDLMSEFKTMTLTGDDLKKLPRLQNCDARFDVFLFEQSMAPGDEGMLDPGGLLLVMEQLAEMCDGVGIDPQSKTLL